MPHYDNVGEPTFMEVNVRWASAEQATKNGWLRRGWVMAEDGRTAIANLIEFNGPERPSGHLEAMFQIVDVTPDKGDCYVQYQLLG